MASDSSLAASANDITARIPRRIEPGSLIGQSFGRLIVESVTGKKSNGHALMGCQCKCGNFKIVAIHSLLQGHSKSCGCLRREMTAAKNVERTTHGHSRGGICSSEYKTWCGMIQRCHNPNDKSYPDYGQRGIRVYQQWRESFEKFIADMGLKPSRFHSIDRIHNDGNYEPGNCRWATDEEQGRNRSVNHVIECRGKAHTLIEWSEITGLTPDCIAKRFKYGWSAERALFTNRRESR
jgi:hypothetical protein